MENRKDVFLRKTNMKKKTNSHPSIMLVYKSRFLTYRFTSEHSTVYETGLNHFFLIAVAMLKWSLFRRTNLRKSLSKAAVTKTEHSLKSMISSSSNLFRSSLIARAFGERRKIPTVVGPSSKSWSSTIYKKIQFNFWNFFTVKDEHLRVTWPGELL